MPSLSQQLDDTARWLRGRLGPAPAVGVVLGSGWDAFAQALSAHEPVPYEEIPYFPLPQVHEGALRVAGVEGVRVACLHGRCHAYEGYSPGETVYAVRALARWGVRRFVLTNAAGGIAERLEPGDLMLIEDHVNLTAANPLVGLGEKLGDPFVDMTSAYDAGWRRRARAAARRRGVALKAGVYACAPGPMYETPAEIRAMRVMGIDAVGMSTVWETIALRHLGAAVIGISCITNKAAGLSAEPLSHEDILRTARQAGGACVRALRAAAAASRPSAPA